MPTSSKLRRKHWSSNIKRKGAFASGFEADVSARLTQDDPDHKHTGRRGKNGDGIPYRLTEDNEYWPDFTLSNGIIVEVKGYFDKRSRDKHLALKSQHPQLDIRFVFQRAKDRLVGSGNSRLKMTAAEWCAKHGFLFAEKTVPLAWINEPTRP